MTQPGIEPLSPGPQANTVLSSISNNSVKYKYKIQLSKTFLFQTIQFSQTVLMQSIQFSISTVFVYSQLRIKTVLFQIIQYNVTQFQCQKQFYFK